MENEIKILIVEDEPIIALSIKEMLLDYGFKHIKIASNFIKAEIFLDEDKTDLVLLDINLEKGQEGIEISKIASEKEIPFLYLTSYNDKTILEKALSTSPSAYLTKPIQPANLFAAVSIAVKSIQEKSDSIIRLKIGIQTISINTKKLLFIHAENNYVKLVCSDKNHLLRLSLSSLREKLNEEVFIQIHRSYLVNINLIDSHTTTELKIGNKTLPISRSFREYFRKAII